MSLTLRQIAELIGGELHGPDDMQITGAAILRDATPGEISLADGEKSLKQLASSKASAVIIGKLPESPAIAYIKVENVHAAFAKVVEAFHPRRTKPRGGIHPRATVAPTSKIGANVEIGPNAVIGDGAIIGDHCTIHAGVTIGDGCRLGRNVTIFSNVVLYEETIVGDDCIIHAGAVLGAYGFGYSVVQGRHELSAQLGYVELGPRVEVGAATTIDRGTYGPTTIGEGTKIDNLVQIAHNCKIGKHNLICAHVGIAGSCSTGDYVVFAGQVGVRDHVHIGSGVRIGAQAGVINDLPDGGAYIGAPAGPEREYLACVIGFNKLPEIRKQLKQLQRDVDELKPGQSGPRAEAA